MPKTNATRALDVLDIPYSIREYPVDPEDLSAASVAAKIEMPVEQVFKTLLVVGDGRDHYFAVVPGDAELDMKALAKLTGNRKIEMVSLKDVQPLTGYIRGGVTVMAAKTHFPVFCDETVWLFEAISVSAGARGTQVILSPDDYLRATGATVANLVK